MQPPRNTSGCRSKSAVELDDTTIEMMFCGAFQRGAGVALGNGYVAVCLNGRLWRVEDNETEVVMGMIRPANCSDTEEVKNRLRQLRERDL